MADDHVGRVKPGVIIGLASLLIAVIGAVVAVTIPEIRCWIDLDECDEASSSEPEDGESIVDAPYDPNLPSLTTAPAAAQIQGEAPFLELEITEIVNRGEPSGHFLCPWFVKSNPLEDSSLSPLSYRQVFGRHPFAPCCHKAAFSLCYLAKESLARLEELCSNFGRFYI